MADRQYELVYILPPDSTEAQVAEVQTQIEEVVTRLKGQIAATDNWGRKRLAYEIARHKEGFYVLQTINGSGELMKELDRRLKVMDIVIRQMIVRVDEAKKVVDTVQTRRRTNSERLAPVWAAKHRSGYRNAGRASSLAKARNAAISALVRNTHAHNWRACCSVRPYAARQFFQSPGEPLPFPFPPGQLLKSHTGASL